MQIAAAALVVEMAYPGHLNNLILMVIVFLVGFITSEGLYWAQLSAAATMAAMPVIIAGWVAQNKLVQGLSFGAVK